MFSFISIVCLFIVLAVNLFLGALAFALRSFATCGNPNATELSGDLWEWFNDQDEYMRFVYLEIWPIVLIAHVIEKRKSK
jgi:hypothetical protein